jgi:hypothetical protein
MRWGGCAVLLVGGLAEVAVSAAGEADDAAMTSLLRRVGERVEEFFARAQSLICLETVRVQPLQMGLTPDGHARQVESELRVSWEARSDNASPEARTLREVLRVNGSRPRRKDPNNCTAPEQVQSETPALAMLLPDKQAEYSFSAAGTARLDRREAVLIDYRERAPVTVDVTEVADNPDCVNFDLSGGLRGRIWIDPETAEVLRLDQSLIGLVDIRVPRKVWARSGGASSWTMERWDTSTRFARVAFHNPDESLLLPISVSSLRITRGSGSPRLRTTTEFTRYRRFLTGGRVVP